MELNTKQEGGAKGQKPVAKARSVKLASYALPDKEMARMARESFSVSEDGLLRWRVPHGRFGRFAAGDVAGCLVRGYRAVSFAGEFILAHRIVWLMKHGVWPQSMLDHINGKRDDNRIENLRLADYTMNNQNQHCVPRHNTSGTRGVSWDCARGRWTVRISINGRAKNLGRFDSIEEAEAAYLAARKVYHPGFMEAKP